MFRTATAIAAAATLTACSSSGGKPSAAGPSPGYVSQRTTCAQWLAWSDYDRGQAAYIIAGPLGAKDSGYDFSLRFARMITKVCGSAPGTERVAEAAAFVATLDHADFR